MHVSETGGWTPRGGIIPALRLLLYLLAVGAALAVVQTLVLAVISAVRAGTQIDELLALPVWFLTAVTVPSAVAVVILTLAFVRYVDRRPPELLGLAREGSWAAETWVGIGLGMGLPILIFAVSYLAGWITITGTLFAASAYTVVLTIFMTLLLMVAISFMEEVMMRGYVLQTLRWGYGTLAAVVVSSLIFGIFHMLNPEAAFPGFLGTTAAGLVLAYGYLVTGRLWLPIGYHFGWNFALGPILGFPVSGVSITGWIVQETRGPVMFTGGDFGPEAGLLGLGVLLIGVWVIRRYAPHVRTSSGRYITDHEEPPEEAAS